MTFDMKWLVTISVQSLSHFNILLISGRVMNNELRTIRGWKIDMGFSLAAVGRLPGGENPGDFDRVEGVPRDEATPSNPFESGSECEGGVYQ